MHWLLLFCILATATATPILGQEPSSGVKSTVEKPDRKPRSQQAGYNDQRGTKNLPLIVDTEGHQQTEPEKKEAAEKEDRAREAIRWTLYFAQLTTWATVALVIIGFGGVLAAAWTLRQVKRQADLMKAQLTEMQSASAQAAKHLSLTERPWISLEMQPGSSVSFDDRGMMVKLSVKLSNVGKSPAKVVALIFHVHLVAEGEVPERHRNQFIELCRRHWQAETQFVMFPGEELAVPNSYIVGPSELNMVGGRLYPYLFVSLSYRSTLDPDSRPFSFYTYMIRSGAKTDSAGFEMGKEYPPGIVDMLQDVHRFGPIAE